MGRLILSTSMTVDGVISVTDWYVSDGGHDQAGRDLFDRTAVIVLGRKTYEGLAVLAGTGRALGRPHQSDAEGRRVSDPRGGRAGVELGVTLLRYEL